MRTFTFESIEESYKGLLKALLEEGEIVSPRGQLTKEITPVSITINNPKKRVIGSKVRKLNYGFMCGELLWILNGSNDVDFIGHYNSIWKTFSDDGKTLNGAYGKRIFKWDSGNRVEDGVLRNVTINQFMKAYEQLKADKYSRQATIVFFDPYLDYTQTKDKPCTNLIRFMIRKNKLNMTTFMRSNDIWLGYPYDVFNFTVIQEILAGMLGVEVGKYTHIADSFHIYERNFEDAKRVIEEDYNSIYSENRNNITISEDEYQKELNKAFEIEKLTRENQLICMHIVTEKLSLIKDEYLRSITGVLALYNFRKYGRSQKEMDAIKNLISNEFKLLTSGWVSKQQ